MKKNQKPYVPSVLTALTVNQVAISAVTATSTENGPLVRTLSIAFMTAILTYLISLSVVSWAAWHRDLMVAAKEQRQFPPRGM